MTLIIYSRSSCAPCKTLKYWLNRKQIKFKEVDLDKQPIDNIYLAPTIDIDGQRYAGINLPMLINIITTARA